MKQLKVTLIRSTINRIEAHKRVVKSLGLNKLNSSRIHDDNPVIRGMIDKVRHLVEVTE
ncbi:MAG TPA: 50S ribosomal protein L30 [Candidatus Cloacimonas sp.]|nr:50S ribosomal protein L30 [Candidatus Cloacimonas sp.]